MKWTNCVFDLYGTLVDIHTDESAPCLWENLLEHYRTQGAVYSTPQELKERYFAIVREWEQGSVRLRNDSHESHPEIQIEYVFQQLFQERGVHADMAQAVEAGRAGRSCGYGPGCGGGTSLPGVVHGLYPALRWGKEAAN